VYEWDEAKREANLRKHGLDFLDAYIVYENPEKVTYPSTRRGERRFQDVALVEVDGNVLSLAYVMRGGNVRVISFREASRRERRDYGISRQSSE
jgi:uncharacterized DUF497 family protein